jgi:uncharacterized DUF497 family protein
VRFIWDPVKATANLKKHGVSFDEATGAFGDPHAQYEPDPGHPERGRLIGTSRSHRLLFVVHVELLDTAETRIISARKADRKERRRYEEKG